MTAEERRSIKLKIKANIEALNEHVAALEFSIQQVPTNVNDYDRASRTEMINHKRQCEAQIRGALKKVTPQEIALKRVDGDDFGICVECEKPISTERLLEKPEEFHCVSCEEELAKLA